MPSRRWTTIVCLVTLCGCASNRAKDDANARIKPGDSVRASADTTPYRIRDTVPDTTATGRRDTTSHQ
jgi:hypothetical protein